MRNTTVANYFSSLIHQLRSMQIQANQNYIYKIVGKEVNKKSNEEELIIQVAGKNVFTRITPKKLVQDEATLKGFSPLDVRTITYLACQTESAKKEKRSFYKIISQFFSKSRKEEMFVVQGEDKSIHIAKTAQEISNDPVFINKLSPSDAHKIGYIAGSEQIVIEQELMKNKQN